MPVRKASLKWNLNLLQLNEQPLVSMPSRYSADRVQWISSSSQMQPQDYSWCRQGSEGLAYLPSSIGLNIPDAGGLAAD